MGRPPMAMRSSIECRWGEVKRPVFRPSSRSSDSTMRAVLVLPLVPVTWTTGKVPWGSPSSSITAAMRSSDGSRSCSGVRERIEPSTSRIRRVTSSWCAASRWGPSGAGLTDPFSPTSEDTGATPSGARILTDAVVMICITLCWVLRWGHELAANADPAPGRAGVALSRPLLSGCLSRPAVRPVASRPREPSAPPSCARAPSRARTPRHPHRHPPSHRSPPWRPP